MDYKTFTSVTLKRERGILSSCSVSLISAIDELVDAIGKCNKQQRRRRNVETEEGGDVEKSFELMFLLRTCEREKRLLGAALREMFQAIDEMLEVLSDVEKIDPKEDEDDECSNNGNDDQQPGSREVERSSSEISSNV